jgi:hypothetical protein
MYDRNLLVCLLAPVVSKVYKLKSYRVNLIKIKANFGQQLVYKFGNTSLEIFPGSVGVFFSEVLK